MTLAYGTKGCAQKLLCTRHGSDELRRVTHSIFLPTPHAPFTHTSPLLSLNAHFFIWHGYRLLYVPILLQANTQPNHETHVWSSRYQAGHRAAQRSETIRAVTKVFFPPASHFVESLATRFRRWDVEIVFRTITAGDRPAKERPRWAD